MQITKSRFTGNGGFVHTGGVLIGGGTAFITQSTFDHNTGLGGGAMGVGNGAMLEMTDSAFKENTARGTFLSPGLFLSGSDTTAVIRNTTFARNTLGLSGGCSGGVAIYNFFARLSLINSTVADNVVSEECGRAIISALLTQQGATTILANTIIANNTSTEFLEDCAGPATSLGNNLIGDLTGCAIVLQPGDLTGDPGLGTFTDNGSPGNGHFPLLPTSRAIDAANTSVCPEKDQIGQPRQPHCDIGAIEFSHVSNDELVQNRP